MTINKQGFPFPLSIAFVTILNSEIAKIKLPLGTGVILNFRDPSYSAEEGGFHPVEINIDSRGLIRHITDFSYIGSPPYAELAKEIDFDISLGLFQHFGREFPIHTGRGLYAIFQDNFVSYYQMGIYSVTAVEA